MSQIMRHMAKSEKESVAHSLGGERLLEVPELPSVHRVDAGSPGTCAMGSGL